MTIRKRSAAAVLAVALCFPAAAEDVDGLAGLLNEPVISTASKSAETAGLAPATTSVITSEDLRRHGITSLDQAINFLGLGMLTERAPATPEIGARGVLLTRDYGNHVLLLVDGHALNEPWDETAYYDRSAAIPWDLVDHIEVILGPGSVLYGSSAMLGVVNVITKRAKDYQGLHLLAEGGSSPQARLAAGYGAQFEWLGREGELTAGLDLYQARGPRQSYAPQPYGENTWGGAASHGEIGIPAGHLRLVLGDLAVSVRAAASRRAATQIQTSFDDPHNWERDRWLSVDARWSASLSTRLQAGVRLYGDLYDYFDNAPSASSLDCPDGQASCVLQISGVSRWVGTELNGTYDWLGDGRHVTLVGADVRAIRVTSWVGYQGAARTSGYDKTLTVLGAYVQQTLRPAPWLSLNAGARLDHDDQLGSHLSPRLAAVVPAWTGGTLKAIYSEAFRAPSFYERYYSDALEQLLAQDLRPETVRSVEGVVEQRFGAQRLRLAVFRTWWRDLVMTVPATPQQIADGIASGALVPGASAVYLYANAARVESYGLNADWDGSGLGQRLRYGAGLTLAHARNQEDSSRLPAAAQVFANARISYGLGEGLPVLGLAARAAGPRPLAGTSFDPVPDAGPLFEVHGAVSGPVAGGLSWRLAATWSSTGDTAYAVGPLRAPEPGYDRQTVLPVPRLQALVGLRYDR